MEPYTPILPFEVLSAQLGRAPGRDRQARREREPLRPAPGRARGAGGATPSCTSTPIPEQRELRAALAEYTGVPAEQHPARARRGRADRPARRASWWGRATRSSTARRPSGCTRSTQGWPARGWSRCRGATNFHVDVAAIQKAVAEVRRRCAQPRAARPSCSSSPRRTTPTAACSPPRDLAALLGLPLFVVLDEAYIEFAGLERSVADWVLVHENLIVLRTFSKWAGLAGLRLGYGIFPSWLMPHLWKAKQPYNVNVAATVAGLASLDAPGRDPGDGRRADRRARAACCASWRACRSSNPSRATRTSCCAGWPAATRGN